MKKSFALEHPKHAPERVVASIKNDVRKYLKRERRKELPEGADYWDFDCRVGADQATAEVVHVSKLTEGIDKAVAEKGDGGGIYVEILAKPATRLGAKQDGETDDSEEAP